MPLGSKAGATSQSMCFYDAFPDEKPVSTFSENAYVPKVSLVFQVCFRGGY